MWISLLPADCIPRFHVDVESGEPRKTPCIIGRDGCFLLCEILGRNSSESLSRKPAGWLAGWLTASLGECVRRLQRMKDAVLDQYQIAGEYDQLRLLKPHSGVPLWKANMAL